MRRRWIICVSLVAVAACSGGDDEASSTTALSTVASAPPTTPAPEPTDTTEAPATTAPPATTAAAVATTEPPVETTAPPVETTAPPVETTDPSDPTTTVSSDEAVQARFDVLERAEAAWPTATRPVYNDPFNDELVANLENFYTGNLLEGINNVVQQLRDGNFRTIPRDDQPEIYVADPRSLAVNVESGRATVQVCHINTAILIQVGGNPDGSDRIAEDEIREQIVELELLLVDGVWKVASANEPETEIATCP